MTGDRNIAFSLWGDISRRQRRSQPCVSYEGCPTRACIWLQRMCFVLLCRLIGAGVVRRGDSCKKADDRMHLWDTTVLLGDWRPTSDRVDFQLLSGVFSTSAVQLLTLRT